MNLNNLSKKSYNQLKVVYRRIKRLKINEIIFICLTIFAFINILIMSLFFYDNDYEYKILNKSYVNAVEQNQDINNPLKTNIFKIRQFDFDTVEIGDYVVIFGDFEIPEYWVEEVISKDETTKSLMLTYDGITNTSVPKDDIYGVYLKEANILGTIYHTAMYPRGYFLLMFSHIFILSAYYIYFHTNQDNTIDKD